MSDAQDKPDKFMEILCAPERGPVEWERANALTVWQTSQRRVPRSESKNDAYRCGLVQGMAGMRSLECHGPADWAAAYALGWMRGAFPRPFAAEEAEAPASDDSDA